MYFMVLLIDDVYIYLGLLDLYDEVVGNEIRLE